MTSESNVYGSGAYIQTRTGTDFSPTDFKSVVSANFTIQAFGSRNGNRTHTTVIMSHVTYLWFILLYVQHLNLSLQENSVAFVFS